MRWKQVTQAIASLVIFVAFMDGVFVLAAYVYYHILYQHLPHWHYPGYVDLDPVILRFLHWFNRETWHALVWWVGLPAGIAAVVLWLLRTSAQADQPEPAPGVADELSKLAALREQGILTQEEVEAQKKKLLGD